MNKKTKKLEKENATIKGKCETMNRNILEMAEEVCVIKYNNDNDNDDNNNNNNNQ